MTAKAPEVFIPGDRNRKTPAILTQRELDRMRADTLGVASRAHFNNAGAAMMPAPVLAAMTDHLIREYQIGGYEAAAENYDRINAVYASIARLVGANPEEISIAENATVATLKTRSHG